MKNLFERTFETLNETGTNWTAEKHPLITADGLKTESFGIFRSDTKEWLGTVKDRYVAFQNAELVELLIEATGSLDLNVTNGGTLRNGKKVYFQIELPSEYIGKSSIKRQITALNSHDGSTSIAFGSSNTVVACHNRFFRAYREMEKIKHTTNAKDRIITMVNGIKDTINSDLLLMENFKRMADVEMKDEMIERVINKIFKVNPNQSQDDLSTRKQNQITTFANNLETEIKLEGKTVWGLFNAVTRYTNHEAAPANDERKLDYLMNGQGYQISNMAFSELMTFISKNTAEYAFVNQ